MVDHDFDEDEVEARVRETARRALAGGPIRWVDLLENCVSVPGFGALVEVYDTGPEALVEDILATTDDFWHSESGLSARADLLLDGRVFTHRLTPSEVAAGVAHMTPDLVALYWGVKGLGLENGGMVHLEFSRSDDDGLDREGSLVGPEGWLAGFHPGQIVAFRRSSDGLCLEQATAVGEGRAEALALEAAFGLLQPGPGLGVEPYEVILDALVDHPDLFGQAVAPISELLPVAGLEQVGGFVGRVGEPWESPGVAFRRRRMLMVSEEWGFSDCCQEAMERALESWSTFIIAGTPPGMGIGQDLQHGSVAPAFADWVLEEFDRGSPFLAGFLDTLIADTGRKSAAAHYVRALNHERAGATLAAEADLETAVRIDPGFSPAAGELAAYLADRGDGPRALRMLQRAGVEPENPVLSHLADLFSRRPGVGRNDPCPCGSGRKYKVCCQIHPRLSDRERIGWLTTRLVAYTLRPYRRHNVVGIASSAMIGDWEMEDLVDRIRDPFIVDLALFEGGTLEEYIDERGMLLTQVDRDLVDLFMISERRLWEVTTTTPGAAMGLRDTKTGDQVEVDEQEGSRHLQVGDFVLARVVPAFDSFFVVGVPLRVDLRHREQLIQLLDSSYGPDDLAEWLGWASAPPRLSNREGEDLVMCTLRLEPGPGGWEELTRQLDQDFEVDDSGWTEYHELSADERIIRGFLRREGHELVVETNSVERMDRIRESFPGAVVVGEERLPATTFKQIRALGLADDRSSPGVVDPEAEKLVAEFLDQAEDRWMDEEVPALAGMTPRQAADDPTMRADLVALLRSFEGRVGGFDAARLREKLGLNK